MPLFFISHFKCHAPKRLAQPAPGSFNLYLANHLNLSTHYWIIWLKDIILTPTLTRPLAKIHKCGMNMRNKSINLTYMIRPSQSVTGTSLDINEYNKSLDIDPPIKEL